MAVYQLTNDALTIAVKTAGAELCKVTGKDGTEYLWNADPAYWSRFSPVLFPNVGNFNGKEFTYEGKTYPMGQHGFARDTEFDFVSQTKDTLTFVLNANEETKKKFPLDFALTISYTLKANQVIVSWNVKATGVKPLSFSIGAHPAFNCPLKEGEKQTDYKIDFFTDAKEVVCGVLGSAGCLTEKQMVYPLVDGKLSVTETLFDLDALIVEGKMTDKLALVRPDGSAYVTMIFDAPLFGIWSPTGKNAPFICLEPWYGRSDRESFNGALNEREYGTNLNPGESFDASYTMIFS